VKDPIWVAEGRKYVGMAEIPGPKHNLTILNWLKELKAWWQDDETPWCGVFVAHCMKTAGIDVPKYYMRAKDWATWGVDAKKPTLGCVVVFERQGGGHVGFVVGQDEKGRLMVLGGNQGNKVSIAPFDPARAVAFRVPAGTFVTPSFMPTLAANGVASSTNEA
jgi:uncharacterized protein (TIGR02594 family)